MRSVASFFAPRHKQLFAAVSLFVAVLLAVAWQLSVSTSPFAIGGTEGDRAALGSSADPALPSPTVAHWAAAPFAAESNGQAPRWRLPGGRPELTFGDSVCGGGAAAGTQQVRATARRRNSATATRNLTALQGSLQVQKIRLQI